MILLPHVFKVTSVPRQWTDMNKTTHDRAPDRDQGLARCKLAPPSAPCGRRGQSAAHHHTHHSQPWEMPQLAAPRPSSAVTANSHDPSRVRDVPGLPVA